MTTFGLKNIVWGNDDRVKLVKIENLPADTISWKVKLRPKSAGVAFVKTPGAVTEYVLEHAGECFRLGIRRGSNVRSPNTHIVPKTYLDCVGGSQCKVSTETLTP